MVGRRRSGGRLPGLRGELSASGWRRADVIKPDGDIALHLREGGEPEAGNPRRFADSNKVLMSPRRRWLVVLVLMGWLASGARGVGAAFPPITGELSGKFRATALPGAPVVGWKLKVAPARDGGRQADAELVTPGGRLHARAELDAALASGTWEIADGELSPPAWLAMLAPALGTAAENVAAEGKLTLMGRGEIRDGRPAGMLKLVWTDGALRNSVQGWAIEGITLKGEIAADLAHWETVKSDHPWELAVRTITSPRFGARNLAIAANLNGDGTLSLLSAEIEIAGGKVTVEPATLALFPPVLDFSVHVRRVGLQDLVALVPASLADARGRIDGDLRLGWSAAAGMQIGAGAFELRDDEVATLRLAPSPGLITRGVKDRLPPPAWTGPIGKWLAPKNPVYGDVREIELGQTQLVIESFGLRLTPKGDGQGRTGVAEIAARPDKSGTLVKRVVFDIDLTGSLVRLLELKAEGATFKAR